MATKTTIELRVRELRKAKGWSQTDLGDQIGLDQRTVSRWETGCVRRVPLTVLASLVTVLDVQPGDVFKVVTSEQLELIPTGKD